MKPSVLVYYYSNGIDRVGALFTLLDARAAKGLSTTVLVYNTHEIEYCKAAFPLVSKKFDFEDIISFKTYGDAIGIEEYLVHYDLFPTRAILEEELKRKNNQIFIMPIATKIPSATEIKLIPTLVLKENIMKQTKNVFIVAQAAELAYRNFIVRFTGIYDIKQIKLNDICKSWGLQVPVRVHEVSPIKDKILKRANPRHKQSLRQKIHARRKGSQHIV